MLCQLYVNYTSIKWKERNLEKLCTTAFHIFNSYDKQIPVIFLNNSSLVVISVSKDFLKT